MIPPSDKFIKIAKKHGWKDEDIIKINLPRWDKYIYEDEKFFLNNKFSDKEYNSILVMFTWRETHKNEKISSFYINNIIKILRNDELNVALKIKKIKLYFSLHRNMVYNYQNIFRIILNKNEFIQYINQSDISECIIKSNLILTDFSSIIFDFIYRQKPYILYIPDINESKIKKIYSTDYYNIIESFRNKVFQFENTFYGIKETVNKMIYYINNDFNLDNNLKKFYNSFNLKKGKAINEFINYLKKLK